MKNYILFSLVLFLCACTQEASIPQLPTVIHGTFMDLRDSVIYKTITVGDQTWMAEDLKHRLLLGPVDGCFTYKEIAPDTSNVPVDKKVMNDAMVAEYPNLNSFTDPWGMYWLMALSDFFNPRSAYYNYSYPQFREEVIIAFVEWGMDAAFVDFWDKHYAKLKANALIDYTKINTDFGYASTYGYLYTYNAAQKAIPNGWKLPSDEDWKILEKSLGMAQDELNLLESWRGNLQGRYLLSDESAIGFNALMSGSRYFGNFADGNWTGDDTNYRDIDVKTTFWSSTTKQVNDSTNVAIVRTLQYNQDKIYRGSSSLLNTRYSIRCVKNKI